MTFKDLHLIQPILDALKEQGYTQPTPIQQQAIPILLRGKDLLGCAQTGTGKTAAFAIPIIQNMFLDKKNDKGRRKIKALVVTPTRELAIQISDSFKAYGRHTDIVTTVIFGGVKQGKQTDVLKRGVDILVATPGRLLDLINQGFISLKDVKFSVLDEADHMLDMGFIHDIRKIIKLLPNNRQSLFFSATMPPTIVKLSKEILGNPERVTIRPQQATAERVEQALYYVSKKDKTKLLIHILNNTDAESVLVFSRTKHGSDKIVKLLNKAELNATAIHGNKSQGARQRALKNFKEGSIRILVATDIAARGIDVDSLALVINYNLPDVPETYVHRIGRTGRASASGIAISFCEVGEKGALKDIQKLIGQQISTIDEHPFTDDKDVAAPPKQPHQRRPPRNKPQGNKKSNPHNKKPKRRW